MIKPSRKNIKFIFIYLVIVLTLLIVIKLYIMPPLYWKYMSYMCEKASKEADKKANIIMKAYMASKNFTDKEKEFIAIAEDELKKQGLYGPSKIYVTGTMNSTIVKFEYIIVPMERFARVGASYIELDIDNNTKKIIKVTHDQ